MTAKVARAALGVAALLVPPAAGAPVRACAARLQVYFAADFTDAAYQQTTYKKVAAQWKRPSGTPKPGAKAVVIATIRRDGKAPPPVLHLKSGVEAWDSAAVAAVRNAAPFDALPKSYPRASVEVHVHFECARSAAGP